MRLKPYASIFDTPNDEKKLAEYMKVYSLDLSALEKEIFKFINWYEGKDMKSPRGALTGWLSRRNEPSNKKTNQSGRPKIEAHNEEVDDYAPF